MQTFIDLMIIAAKFLVGLWPVMFITVLVGIGKRFIYPAMLHIPMDNQGFPHTEFSQFLMAKGLLKAEKRCIHV